MCLNAGSVCIYHRWFKRLEVNGNSEHNDSVQNSVRWKSHNARDGSYEYEQIKFRLHCECSLKRNLCCRRLRDGSHIKKMRGLQCYFEYLEGVALIERGKVRLKSLCPGWKILVLHWRFQQGRFKRCLSPLND